MIANKVCPVIFRGLGAAREILALSIHERVIS